MASLALTPRSTLLGKVLRLPLRLLPKRKLMTVRSGINTGYRWIVGSSTHGCWLGTYEWEKQDIVVQLVRPGMKILDIGANAGFYTLAFARLAGAKGHVWAFEPLAANVVHLLQHVQVNGLGNVSVIQAAVADRSGIAGFAVHQSNAMGAISEKASSYRVPTLSLDDLVRDGVIDAPDLVKMDVEGAEALALTGAREILARGQSTWLISLHGAAQAELCVAILRRAGYEVRLPDGAPAPEAITTDEIIAVPGPR